MGLDDCVRIEGEAAAALLTESRFPEHAKYYLRGDPVLVHDGDLELDSLFLPLAQEGPFNLFVRGNLTLHGDYADADDPQTCLIVTGNMTARVVCTNGRLEVHGDLTAKAVIGDYNDHMCQVGGVLRCRIFEPDEHFFEAGSAEIERAMGNKYRLEVASGSVAFEEPEEDEDAENDNAWRDYLVAVFVEDLVESEEDDGEHFDPYLNNAQINYRLRQGLPVFQPGVLD